MDRKEDFDESGLTPEQIEILENLLNCKKKEMIFKNNDPQEYAIDQEDRSDEIDKAIADRMNDQKINFRNREYLFEKKIDEALLRIKNNQFGLCSECNSAIGFKRLYARPTTDLCIICKEETERNQFNNHFSSTPNVRKRMLTYLSPSNL